MRSSFLSKMFFSSLMVSMVSGVAYANKVDRDADEIGPDANASVTIRRLTIPQPFSIETVPNEDHDLGGYRPDSYNILATPTEYAQPISHTCGTDYQSCATLRDELNERLAQSANTMVFTIRRNVRGAYVSQDSTYNEFQSEPLKNGTFVVFGAWLPKPVPPPAAGRPSTPVHCYGMSFPTRDGNGHWFCRHEGH